MSDAAPAPAAARWVSLDALRGLTIAAMILVNNPGRGGAEYQYAPLRHADWHGCTPTDLIFPAFLFVMGTAIVPAFGRQLQNGRLPGELLPRLLRRVGLLVLLGMLLSAFPLVSLAADSGLFAPLLRTRFPGVLQRIGICYGIAAMLFLYTSVRTQRRVLLGCLVLYWPLLYLPIPGGGTVDLATPGAQFGAFLDRTLLGDHIWVKGIYDPEGLLSTIPAVATALFGVEAGRVLAGAGGDRDKVFDLMVRGALLAVAGVVWGWFLPINKALWTGSYAVYTAGLTTAGLGLMHWVCTVRVGPGALPPRWVHPLRVYGVNALLVFVGSGLLGRVVGRLIRVPSGDGTTSVSNWIFENLLASWSEPAFASLLYSVLWVLGWYALLAWLYRRKIVFKV